MKSILYAVTVVFCTLSAIGATPPTNGNKMETALRPFVDQHIISGAVTLVADRNKVLNVEAVGLANLASRKPMSPDALFWIASMTKPMTATALMMLVEEGKVDLNSPVEKYLPEFKGQMVAVESDDNHVLLKKPSHPILVREILSHTSGLLKRCPLDLPKGNQLPLRDLVRTYPLSPLEAQPGTHYDYSNPGINTAGAIIEVVSGMPYERFMAQRLFEPLGMKDTTFSPTDKQLERLATSYRVTPKKELAETDIGPLTYPLTNPRNHPLPAGGLFSTARDVGRFAQMILSNGVLEGRRYLQESSVRMMTSKQTPDSIPTRYGFGWSTGLGGERGAFGHGGAYRTYMFIDPKAGLAGVFMTQRLGAWVTEEEKKVWPAFTRALYETGGVKPPAGSATDPEGAP